MALSQPFQILSLQGPIQLVYGANAPGFTQSSFFSIANNVHGSLLVQALLNGSVSAATFNLEVSLANGQWNTFMMWDAIATPVAVLPIASGAIHRLSCVTFTGAGTIDVWGGVTQVESVDIDFGGGGGGSTVFQGTVPWVVSGNVTIFQGGNQAVVTGTGALKVDGSSVTQPTEDVADGLVGSPVPTFAEQVGGRDSSGDLRAFKTLADGTLVVTTTGSTGSLAAYSVNTGNTLLTVTPLTALISIRPQGASTKTFSLQEIDLGGDGSISHFRLIRNASLTGASFANVGGTSQMQFDTSATAFSGGDVVDSGYFAIGAHDKLFTNLQFNSVTDIFTLVFSGVNGRPAHVGGAFRWSEQ